MVLYDTLSRSKRPLTVGDHGVSVYVCGITPYDSTHLGHAVTYCASDVLIRLLERLGYDVTYVQNLTDIDDAILRAASERKDDWRALGERWSEYYIEDMQTLNVLPPDHFPRATEHIPQMQEVIAGLLEQKVAYESEGAVYFSVDAWKEYGKLSRLDRSQMLPVANEHGNDPDDPRKRDPLDFALWKAEKPGEPSWESPWGPGRPGWHIECSTMASTYLGSTVDIHGGGSDLQFPHHESEIAQSTCASGKPFARFWFHTGMLRHEGEKMSKSVGNLVMVRDLLESHSPDAVRLYLARHHYRESWEHDVTELDRAQKLAEKLASAVSAETDTSGESVYDPAEDRSFCYRMLEDDLQVPAVITRLEAVAEKVLEGGAERIDVSAGRRAIRELADILGLRLDRREPDRRVVDGWGRLL